MLNKTAELLEQLRILGLRTDEARLYLELLRGPSTHLRLSHATGINRTKVYRLISDLQKRSLVIERTDDRGTLLTAADPSSLEAALISQEEKLKQQRHALQTLTPELSAIQAGDVKTFAIQTYEGVDGFKQMLWHELKAPDNMIIFGGSNIDDLVDDRKWADRHRALTIEAKRHVRELLNPVDKEPFDLMPELMHYYSYRIIPSEVLLLNDSMSIYGDTVATYHWREGQKVGVEIIDRPYATMMRQIFEHYWELAGTAL